MRDLTTTVDGSGRARVPTIPDWSIVTSDGAKRALEDIFKAGRWDGRLGGIDPYSAGVLAAVLRLYAANGRPPSVPELVAQVPMAEMAMTELLDRLASHDLVLLGPDRTSLLGAYPFIERVTGHAVTFERTGKTLNTMCAIDALGAGAMCRDNLSIRSTCRFCDHDIIADITDQAMMLQKIRPADAWVCGGLRQS